MNEWEDGQVGEQKDGAQLACARPATARPDTWAGTRLWSKSGSWGVEAVGRPCSGHARSPWPRAQEPLGLPLAVLT